MTAPLLSVRDLVVRFRSARGLVHAVDGVSFDVSPGEIVGVVGESGCGKSSLARCLIGLNQAQGGSIRLGGEELVGRSRGAWRPLRKQIQIVFQDPYASLNPRLTIGRLIEEPMRLHGLPDAPKRRAALMDRVGLAASWDGRYPHELSGGQRQRVGIARALALEPALLICDEPVSALDVSVQAQVVNLLLEIRKERNLAMLFITHDLGLVQHVADRTLVMYLGRIVEAMDAEAWNNPAHPYARALRAASPEPDPDRPLPPPLEGDPPSPLNRPEGCHFRPRCAMAIGQCLTEPVLRDLRPNHRAACHRAMEEA
ncbi:ABC transporter ATP-binding protein [Humitalea sp. 24SJ18S-53]|uniref:ABC transporter ATP-binding protein n=1 Tax=Humitalea sp. 24SJ18S-53 TaxID=3422307 RepID=UPI003D66F74B